jgi:uncharacterized membrane protein
MMSSLHILFNPLLPATVLYLLAAIAVLIALLAISRRAKGSVLRSIFFVLMLLILANPTIIREQREPLKDKALIVIDDSSSMKLGDRNDQVTHAVTAITEELKKISDLTVETLHVPGDNETDLFQAITNKLQSLPSDRIAGIIALTDGQIHDTLAAVITAPFHALIAGHHGEIDRRIIVKSAPSYGMVGKSVTLTLRIEDTPKPQNDEATVTLQRDDGWNQSITLPIGKDVPLDVPVAHAGQNVFAFTVDGVPNELTSINNSVIVNVNGIRDKLRVLLVSGAPHIGGRTWRNLLKADPAVDLVHFTILRTPDKDTFAPSQDMALIAFPSHELFDVKLKDFDLVIFDRFSNRSLMPDEYLENIAHYVENGGALLITNATDESMSGFNRSPIDRLLPAQPTGRLLTGSFVPDLSAAGKRHPVTATLTSERPRADWGPWFRQIDANVKGGETLMTGMNGAPLLVLDHVGKGRVAQFLSDQFWLWGRGYEKGGPQAELLRRVAHWLVSEPELDETALRATSARHNDAWQLTISKRSLHDDQVNVMVVDAHDKAIPAILLPTDKAGMLSATVPLAEPGLYHVKDGDKELVTVVGVTSAPEFGNMIATEDKLAPVVKTSGGGIFWLQDHPEGPALKRTDANSSQQGWDWIGLRRNGQYHVTGSEDYPLWPAWSAIAILLAITIGMWWREGRS